MRVRPKSLETNSSVSTTVYRGGFAPLLTGSTLIQPPELLRVHSKVSGGGNASTSHTTVEGSWSAAPISFTSRFRHKGLSVRESTSEVRMFFVFQFAECFWKFWESIVSLLSRLRIFSFLIILNLWVYIEQKCVLQLWNRIHFHFNILRLTNLEEYINNFLINSH